MRVDQLNERKIKEKKTWVKNIRFKSTFLNYFLQDRFYPDVAFYGWNYQTDIKAREGFSLVGFYIV